MERKPYSQHPDKKVIVISKSTKPRNGGQWRQVVVHTPNGKKVNGKPALSSQTYHERVS